MNRRMTRLALGAMLGLGAGYLTAMMAWVATRLAAIDVGRSLAGFRNQGAPGVQVLGERQTDHYRVRHTVEDGIERIVYTPMARKHETPLLFIHGMWHGAWCWSLWQGLFAQWGWESVAFSLPGHANSPEQRPIKLATLDYYLGFVKAEVDRLPVKPVLFGHSMGGALTQWYQQHVADDLPAALLVASWPAVRNLPEGLPAFLAHDPIGTALMFLTWSGTPMVRTPYHAGRSLLTEGALVTPEALHAKLGPESALVLFQHNPPFWRPNPNRKTPLVWLGAMDDRLIPEPLARRSAAFYGANYWPLPGGHNLMMEKNQRETALAIHQWLESLELA